MSPMSEEMLAQIRELEGNINEKSMSRYASEAKLISNTFNSFVNLCYYIATPESKLSKDEFNDFIQSDVFADFQETYSHVCVSYFFLDELMKEKFSDSTDEFLNDKVYSDAFDSFREGKFVDALESLYKTVFYIRGSVLNAPQNVDTGNADIVLVNKYSIYLINQIRSIRDKIMDYAENRPRGVEDRYVMKDTLVGLMHNVASDFSDSRIKGIPRLDGI